MTNLERHLKEKQWEEQRSDREALGFGIREHIPEFQALNRPFVPIPLRCRLDWLPLGWWMHRQVRIGKHGMLPRDRSLYMCVKCGKVSTIYCWGGVDSGGCRREYWGYADPNVVREVHES